MKLNIYYQALKGVLQDGSLTHLNDSQYIIPITVMARDMKANYSTFKKKLEDPGKLTVKDIRSMAALIGMEPEALFKQAFQQQKVTTRAARKKI
jgi:hypothetical protein